MGEARRTGKDIRFTSTRHVSTPCLSCGKPLDSSSMVGPNGETATPSEGDMTVCLYCRHLMTYNADLSLRNLTGEEIIEVAGEPILVSMIDLLGAYEKDEELEARRRRGEPQAGDAEVSRQVHRQARRAAVAFLKASRKPPTGLE